jgi:cobalt/nickel transport system permease protein
MAFVMPMAGYVVYRVVAGRAALTAPRRALAAGIGGYVGLNVAALCAAIEFGVQPSLFHRADGTPLYAPFHLAQTIPTMLLAHLTVAGAVELALTAGVIAYLQRANLPLLRINHRGIPDTVEPDRDDFLTGAPRRAARDRPSVMVVLTSLGLLAPGAAFGEDKRGGYWRHALLDGYGLPGVRDHQVGYPVSAAVGVVLIGGVVLAIAALLRAGGRRRSGQRARA